METVSLIGLSKEVELALGVGVERNPFHLMRVAQLPPSQQILRHGPGESGGHHGGIINAVGTAARTSSEMPPLGVPGA